MNYLDCMVNFMQLRHALSGLKILKKRLRPAQRPPIHHVAARFSVSSYSPIGVTAGNIGAMREGGGECSAAREFHFGGACGERGVVPAYGLNSALQAPNRASHRQIRALGCDLRIDARGSSC